MLIFILTIHNLWGRVFEKFQEPRVVDYTDDRYIKGKLSVALQVLTEVKGVLKEDAGLELNVSKTSILPKGITEQAMFGVEHNFRSPAKVDKKVYTFVRNFVSKTYRGIIDDLEKLDVIQDGFVHYQFLRFYRSTRLQYTNSHILLDNR